MSKKNKNPYRSGSAYHSIFADWQKKQIVTESGLLEAGHKKADIGVVVRSPRKSSTRGDCRGNISCQGHLYFAELPKRKVVDGVKSEQKYRLRWRKDVLEPRKRNEKASVEAVKVEVKAKAKAKTKTKAKAKAKKATAKAK
jgi:hypothetical protein